MEDECQIPCEICSKLIAFSLFASHQRSHERTPAVTRGRNRKPSGGDVIDLIGSESIRDVSSSSESKPRRTTYKARSRSKSNGQVERAKSARKRLVIAVPRYVESSEAVSSPFRPDKSSTSSYAASKSGGDTSSELFSAAKKKQKRKIDRTFKEPESKKHSVAKQKSGRDSTSKTQSVGVSKLQIHPGKYPKLQKTATGESVMKKQSQSNSESKKRPIRSDSESKKFRKTDFQSKKSNNSPRSPPASFEGAAAKRQKNGMWHSDLLPFSESQQSGGLAKQTQKTSKKIVGQILKSQKKRGRPPGASVNGASKDSETSGKNPGRPGKVTNRIEANKSNKRPKLSVNSRTGEGSTVSQASNGTSKRSDKTNGKSQNDKSSTKQSKFGSRKRNLNMYISPSLSPQFGKILSPLATQPPQKSVAAKVIRKIGNSKRKAQVSRTKREEAKPQKFAPFGEKITVEYSGIDIYKPIERPTFNCHKCSQKMQKVLSCTEFNEGVGIPCDKFFCGPCLESVGVNAAKVLDLFKEKESCLSETEVKWRWRCPSCEKKCPCEKCTTEPNVQEVVRTHAQAKVFYEGLHSGLRAWIGKTTIRRDQGLPVASNIDAQRRMMLGEPSGQPHRCTRQCKVQSSACPLNVTGSVQSSQFLDL
eukprot:187049_1